ncbi:sister chromatid cohesion C-terminus-domain-containing protein [Parachaetomium inaequale]|uniref:Sister chromatid cohesion protein n=1 Tax=Parachaetomium inaequale TaxID=2588326 RepID=A0AAN6PLX2_9PEZI|nr:sister chromatid cohesion C-terminus-domain-containing protein [Parachaetomium inaequale]
MADPRPDIYNGHPHGMPTPAPQGGQPPPAMAFTRPFTLYEALPYTPFSSIAPFDSERGNIPEFKFKTGPKALPSSSDTPKPPSLAATLTPFSKMVHDQTAIPFRYPTPDTPTSLAVDGPANVVRTPVPAKQSLSVSQKPVQPKQEHSPITPVSRQAHTHNKARFEIVLPTKSQLEAAAALNKPAGAANIASTPTAIAPHGALPYQQQQVQQLASPSPIDGTQGPVSDVPTKTSSHAPSASQKAAIAIELPSATKLNKEEYLVVPDVPDEPMNLSLKKRKREEDVDGDDLYGDSLDMRQRADAALHELRLFLHNAFQAEDHALAQQYGNEMVVVVADNEATLTAAAQSKAQTLLAKAISLNCYKRVPLDHLLHLLRLSEGALRQAESLEIKVDESWGAAEVDQWLQQLPLLETAMRAARTSLRIMCGDREDKQLYPEDMIERCLNLCKRLIDGAVLPIVELRSTQNTAELFRAISSSKKKIIALFTDCQKLFSLMSTLISKVDTSDTVTNTLEFAASRLIFMETANAEKDSVIDTQKFDGLRLVAMDMLSQIFLLNPSQRQGIFDEILTSLEKLPLGRRARTFKLVDGNSIQPVSALIMRLVQTSAGKVDERKGKNRGGMVAEVGQEANGDLPLATQESFTIRDEDHGASQHSTAIQELDGLATSLLDTARTNASYVIKFIVNRALKSTKSGDTPYRNLLDLFVEDFTTCLDNPDWPASELLLRLLMVMMVNLVENDKSGVPAKNMALELLGSMGAAISKLRGHVRKVASALDARDADELGMFISDLAASALELKSRPEHMVSWTGPYRATLKYLETRFSEDPHLASAISFIVSDWGTKVCLCYDSFEDDFRERDQELGRLAYRLREMIQDRRWLSNEYSFKDVTPSQAKLSYSITLLRSQLCEAFSGILNILLNSMASDQPTVRSKSLKSINQVLETDPSILDGDSIVIQMILRCSNDSSTQVRDSALGLIGKCIGMRPVLEERMTETVVDRFSDAGPGVRKRAMKLAKDIYLRNNNRVLRSAIANGLLHRIQDPEESVRDLARQVIEEIWFNPFHSGENSTASQISLAEHVSLMVQTVKRGSVANVLDKVLQTLLAPESKTAQASMEVCTKLVASMFDLVDNGDSNDPSTPSGRDVLQVLMIFAKAEASLFTFEQLRLLKPHITSIGSSDDLAVSRAVVVIYRRVLPQLSSAHAEFLADVRKELLPAVSKVPRALLDDVMACLWIISTLLETSEHLARLVLSSLRAIQKLRSISQKDPLDALKIRQFDRYSLIVGMAGKHCDLDSHLELFKTGFPNWKGETASKLMVDVVVPCAAPAQPLDVRKAALDSVGLVCQASPRNYVSANVYTTFQQVFDEQVPALESMILRSLKEFLFTEEKRSEQASEVPAINGAKSEKKRELTVIGGTNYDDVASATTHRFLREVTRIATSTQDDHAFLAVEVLASINRQGLVHPKETGVTFITLETSSNSRISELAFLEHKSLHGKHETVVEREYVKAIQSAFAYQRDIVKDPRGATANPFTPKLHLLMEVLKISKSKNRQKFLEKFCTQVDFDTSKLDISEELPAHVQYSRFIVENLAFFEYVTVGELHCIVSVMEKLVTSTGATVAQAIESEVFQVRMDAIDPTPSQLQPQSEPTAVTGEAQPQPEPAPPAQPEVTIDLPRLRQLTAASMILLALWEVRTYLRRLYGMGTTNRRESKGKLQSKDLSKMPVKVQGITGDKVWEEIGGIMTALVDRQRMMATCKAFVELMNVDKEFLVPVEEDEDMDVDAEADPLGLGSGAEDEMDEQQQPAGRGRKRKAQGGAGPKKKRARSGSQQPRKRGRPRKQSAEAQQGLLQDGEGGFDEGGWF